MTNSWHLASELQTKCDGKHEHERLVGGKASEAEIYPDGLCKAICRGLIKEKNARRGGAIPLRFGDGHFEKWAMHERKLA